LQPTGFDRRVVVVDDHDPWRRQIASLIAKTPGWQVVGEAADGAQAVAVVGALRPDLTLLDVELPVMNGIQAARRILAQDPDARILFVTMHRSLDIVEATFAAGARGYVLKTDAGHDLLPAMEAVVEGRRFIGSLLTGRTLETMDQDETGTRCHEVVVSSDDAVLVEAYARFAKRALNAGKSLIVLCGESRRAQIRHRLEADGVDIDFAISQGRYLLFYAEHVLADFMVDGWPDEARFWKAATSCVLQAAKNSRASHALVAACGECAASLMASGNVDAAVRVEQLWDGLARAYNVDTLCAYPPATPGGDPTGDVWRKIYHEHSTVHA
jgi:CheY-like chemotaxis protein